MIQTVVDVAYLAQGSVNFDINPEVPPARTACSSC